jgi:hypothetical protein
MGPVCVSTVPTTSKKEVRTMAIPKELIADVEAFKNEYNAYLDGNLRIEVFRRLEVSLETNLGRSGVKNPRHKIDSIKEGVKARRIADRKAAARSTS